jgi:lipoprotein NlpI
MKHVHVGLIALGLATPALAQDGSLKACLAGDARNAAELSQTLQVCTRAIDSGGLSPVELANAYVKRARIHYARQDRAAGLADLDRAVAAAPELPAPVLARAAMHAADGRHAEAIEDIAVATKLDRRFSVLYRDTAEASTRRRDWRAVVLYLTAWLEREPNDVANLVKRGNAYDYLDERDAAMADFNAAVAARPNAAQGYVSRGNALSRHGQHAAAIADLDKAVELAPEQSWVRYRRGHAHWSAGDFAKAATDFAANTRAEPAVLYNWLWLMVAQGRLGKTDSQVAADVAKQDLSRWPGPVVELYLGRLTPDAMLNAAEQLDQQATRDRLCEAHFFLGQYLLNRGDKAGAMREFDAAVATGVREFIEYFQARVELARLKG